MQIVLNTGTNTAHRPSADGSSHPAACGALRYVPADRIRTISTETLVRNDEIDRCGRCFDGVGGY